DNMLELLLAGGMDIIRAMRLLVPPAWQNNPDMDQDLRAFFDFMTAAQHSWFTAQAVLLAAGVVGVVVCARLKSSAAVLAMTAVVV
ncbi:hypothetical protein MJM99_32890, partial [Salmonella enterica subsp. enterica serovar Kentucky]|nr:hypothetical protein [Salmonella enterica subsp. enterica serovar Kentucky]